MSNTLLGFLLQSMREKYFAKSCCRSAALSARWVNLPHSLPKPSTVAASRFPDFINSHPDAPYCTHNDGTVLLQMRPELSQVILEDEPGVNF